MKRLAFCLLALAALSAQAQVYSCKDANGRHYYTSNPPTDRAIACKPMSKATQAPEDTPVERKAMAERGMADRKQRQEAQEAAAKAEKDKAAAEEKKQQCERAKANLQGLESGQVRFTMGPGGERVALEGAVRDQEIANARKAADAWCK